MPTPESLTVRKKVSDTSEVEVLTNKGQGLRVHRFPYEKKLRNQKTSKADIDLVFNPEQDEPFFDAHVHTNSEQKDDQIEELEELIAQLFKLRVEIFQKYGVDVKTFVIRGDFNNNLLKKNDQNVLVMDKEVLKKVATPLMKGARLIQVGESEGATTKQRGVEGKPYDVNGNPQTSKHLKLTEADSKVFSLEGRWLPLKENQKTLEESPDDGANLEADIDKIIKDSADKVASYPHKNFLTDKTKFRDHPHSRPIITHGVQLATDSRLPTEGVKAIGDIHEIYLPKFIKDPEEIEKRLNASTQIMFEIFFEALGLDKKDIIHEAEMKTTLKLVDNAYADYVLDYKQPQKKPRPVYSVLTGLIATLGKDAEKLDPKAYANIRAMLTFLETAPPVIQEAFNAYILDTKNLDLEKLAPEDALKALEQFLDPMLGASPVADAGQGKKAKAPYPYKEKFKPQQKAEEENGKKDEAKKEDPKPDPVAYAALQALIKHCIDLWSKSDAYKSVQEMMLPKHAKKVETKVKALVEKLDADIDKELKPFTTPGTKGWLTRPLANRVFQTCGQSQGLQLNAGFPEQNGEKYPGPHKVDNEHVRTAMDMVDKTKPFSIASTEGGGSNKGNNYHGKMKVEILRPRFDAWRAELENYREHRNAHYRGKDLIAPGDQIKRNKLIDDLLRLIVQYENLLYTQIQDKGAYDQALEAICNFIEKEQKTLSGFELKNLLSQTEKELIEYHEAQMAFLEQAGEGDKLSPSFFRPLSKEATVVEDKINCLKTLEDASKMPVISGKFAELYVSIRALENYANTEITDDKYKKPCIEIATESRRLMNCFVDKIADKIEETGNISNEAMAKELSLLKRKLHLTANSQPTIMGEHRHKVARLIADIVVGVLSLGFVPLIKGAATKLYYGTANFSLFHTNKETKRSAQVKDIDNHINAIPDAPTINIPDPTPPSANPVGAPGGPR